MSSSEQPFHLPNILANHSTCQKFCGLYEECLTALSDSFPECKLTQDALHHYKTDIQNHEEAEVALIKDWHKRMMSLYERADRHDDTVWEVLPLLSDVQIMSKIQDKEFPRDSVQVLWEYVDGMNRHSRIYNAIPTHMLEKIQSTAMDYMGKVQRGEMKLDIENLNWDEVKNMGQSLMDSVDPTDLEEFTGNINGLAQSLKINNLQDVFKLVGEVPGVSEVINNNSHFVGLLEQLFQNDSTHQMMANMDKMMGGGNNGNNDPPAQ
jgi:hypothetical protein